MKSNVREATNTGYFLEHVKKNTYIKELDVKILFEFVEKIALYNAKKVNGHRIQRITILYNGIGAIAIPKTEKSA